MVGRGRRSALNAARRSPGWTGKVASYELENMLQQESLGAADRLKLREELEVLTDGDLSEREQVKRWKRVKELSPGLWERGGVIIQDLVTDYAKRKLDI